MAQMSQTASLVALNVFFLLLFTWLINTWLLGHPYPCNVKAEDVQTHNTRDVVPMVRGGLDHADLVSAVTALNSFVDIQEDELVKLYNLAVDHAFERHIGLTCADVMSRDVISVKTDTHIESHGIGYATIRSRHCPC